MRSLGWSPGGVTSLPDFNFLLHKPLRVGRINILYTMFGVLWGMQMTLFGFCMESERGKKNHDHRLARGLHRDLWTPGRLLKGAKGRGGNAPPPFYRGSPSPTPRLLLTWH